jgi:hypothetical protein
LTASARLDPERMRDPLDRVSKAHLLLLLDEPREADAE